MLKYNTSGSGKTIIFINGAGTGPWMWKNQITFVKGKCIIFDLPGHGNNNDVNFTTITSAAEDVIDIIKNETDEKVILVGLSIGAQIVMSIIENNPEYVEKCIIISGLNKPMKWSKFLLKPMVSLSMPLVKNRKFSKIQAKEIRITDDLFEKYYSDTQLVTKKSLLNVIDENISFKFLGSLVETLILFGSEENNLIKKSSKIINSLIPSSEIIVFEDAGHGIPYEKPEKLNLILNNLFK